MNDGCHRYPLPYFSIRTAIEGCEERMDTVLYGIVRYCMSSFLAAVGSYSQSASGEIGRTDDDKHTHMRPQYLKREKPKKQLSEITKQHFSLTSEVKTAEFW